MKRIISILIIIFSLLTLVSCNTNKNTKLIIVFGQSNKFSEKDVSDAVQVVINNFDFKASALKKVWYDEDMSDKFIPLYKINNVNPNDIILALSDFYVDDSGDNPVLNPDSTYEDYQCILIRDDDKDEWKIYDFGY